MKFNKLATVAACIAIGFAANAQAATYKIATNIADTEPAAQLIQEFAGKVDERTDGRVKFKVFGNGVLGTQENYIQQIQKGVVDAALVNSAAFESIVPAFGVINLPYMFRDLEEYGTVMNDPSVRSVLEEGAMAQKIVPLGFFSNGFRDLMTTKPVYTIDDLKGMKIRSLSSETYLEMLDRFGATPTPMAYTDTFPALQQGIIDGAEGGLVSLISMNYGQVTKYAIKTGQTRLSDFVVVSERFRSRVGEDDFRIVQEEFAKVSDKSLDIVDAISQQGAEQARDTMGVEIITVDKAPFIAAVEPMYAKAFADEEKRPVIEAIFAIEGRDIN